MTPTQFRKIALSFAGASENAHMNHPDFRAGGRIFATLGYPDAEHGMVVLPPEEQAKLIKSHPKVFAPAKGAWGKRGSTTVRLELVDKTTLQRALELAWRNKSAKKDR
ncbi:MAG TPA: MmcQ/YjbR family DNA-binding protein [Chthoniobacterales bacterium]|nr:MmcQ/YjbR family DNA-binding protein [Chthoniobacterales bacterium]